MHRLYFSFWQPKIFLPGLFILLVSFSNSFGQSSVKNELLWEITGNNLESPSYVFGTMHLTDSRVFELGDSVLLAIDACDKFAIEVHPDSLSKSMFNMVDGFSDDNPLKELLSPEEYKELSERFEDLNGYSFEEVQNKNPFLLQFSLQPDLEREDDYATFLDAHLYGIARTRNKEILGLEDVDLHMKYFDSANIDAQKEMIQEMLKFTKEENKDELNKFVEIYRSGDLTEIEKEMGAHLNDPIMILRNEVMVESIVNEIHEGSLFSAVGAAHLRGEHGIVQLLEEKGYSLRPVTYTYSNLLSSYPIEPEKFETIPFIDKEKGYKLQVPGEMLQITKFGTLELNMHIDMATNHLFCSMALEDMGMSQMQGEDELLNSIIERMDNGEMKLENRETTNWKGHKTLLANFTAKDWATEMKMLFKDGLIYQFSVVSPIGHTNESYAESFFDSIEFLEVPKPKVAEWQTFTHEKAAFKIETPGKMERVEQKVPIPDNPSRTQIVTIFYHTDLTKAENFFVSYNDFPLGYYLDNVDGSYYAITEEFKLRNIEILSDFKPIEMNGLEARVAEIILPGDSYCRLVCIIRGNRVYRLFKQNLKPGDRTLSDDQFFSSFELLPYQQVETATYNDKEEQFSVMEFDETYKDCVLDQMLLDVFKTSCSYSTSNPNSGGVYLTEINTLQPYFRTERLDSFYSELSGGMLGWNDSMLYDQPIEYLGEQGIRFSYFDSLANQKVDMRYVLYGDRLIGQYIYGTDEEMNSAQAKEFFTSLKVDREKEPYDYLSSKLQLILDDLSSEDSLKRDQAMMGLQAYQILEDDLELVMSTLYQSMPDDTIRYYGTRELLLDGVTGYVGVDHLNQLKEIYKLPDTKDPLKASILLSSLSTETKEGTSAFFDLFLNDPPEKPGYSYRMLSEFADSTSMLEKHMPFIVSLLEKDDYRSTVCSVLNQYAKKGEAEEISVRKFNKEISAGKVDELKTAIDKEGGKSLPWELGAYSYLYLMQSVKGLDMTEAYTRMIIDDVEDRYLKNEALITRIENNLKVKKRYISEALDSTDSRYPTIVALQNVDKLELVPKEYLQNDSIVKDFLLYQLNYDEDYPDRLNQLGIILHQDSSYHAMEAIYEFSEPSSSYLVLVGPIPPESTNFDFETLDYHTNWIETEENWKEQAKAMLKEME